mgnify:CR=1 FL=1
MKKKSILLSSLIMLIASQLNASDLNSKIKLQSIYEKQLSRFDCVYGSDINNPEWECNKAAPEGWGSFYGKKYKNISIKINRHLAKINASEKNVDRITF